MIFSRLLHLTIIILIILIQPWLSCCSLTPPTRILTETGQCITVAAKFAVLKDCIPGNPNQLIYREPVNETHIVMYNSQHTKALCYDTVASRVVSLRGKRYCERPGENITTCVPRKRRRYQCHVHEIAAQGYVYLNFGDAPQDFIAWKKGGALRKAKDRFCDVNKVRHKRSKRRSGSARSKELLYNDISASRESASLEHYVSHEKRRINALVSKEKEYLYDRLKSREQLQLSKPNRRRHSSERKRHSSERRRTSKRRQNSLERRRNPSHRRRNSSERRRHSGDQGSGKCREKRDKFLQFMYDT